MSTSAAIRLAPRVEDTLQRIRDPLGDEVPFAPADERRLFVVAGTDYTSAVPSPVLTKVLCRDARNVDLHVVGYDKDALGAMLEARRGDVAVGVFPDLAPGTICKLLFTEVFVGVARRGHPVLANGPPDLAMFATLDHALVSVRRDARGVLDVVLAALRQRRRVAFVTPHMASVPGVIASTDLVAALSARLAIGLREDLMTFPLPIELPPWRVDMLWNPGSRRDRASTWFQSTIQKVCADILS